nr:MAG TPA: hypothetical protein [Caudoviricetes sp.]
MWIRLFVSRFYLLNKYQYDYQINRSREKNFSKSRIDFS